jgi:UDP-glucose 4-epimerase
MKVLVTGGLGYIGSHTVVELLVNNFDVVIADNLYNSQIETLTQIERITGKKVSFYNIDITNLKSVISLFEKEKISSIIHFAGYKAVGESNLKPLKYYMNNIVSSINIAKIGLKFKVKKIIFSSSATVYGNGTAPFSEDMKLLERTNPYGESKAMIERILTDFSKSNNAFPITFLRYFNPVGAHKSGLIGEKPKGIPNNLMPYIAQVANGIRKNYIFMVMIIKLKMELELEIIFM